MSRGKPERRTQTVKRAKSSRSRGVARRPARKRGGPSLWQRLLAAQPLPAVAVRRVIITGLLGLFGVAGWQAASVSGVNAYLSAELVDAVGRAGFTVKRVHVVGANRVDNLRIYDIALNQTDRSMAAVDVAEVRRELLGYGWVADARVSRRLPDTLVIDLVERSPVAVWQDRGRYTLIDGNGRLLPGVDPASVPGLPVIVGRGARRQMPGLQSLLAAAPALRPRISGASWMGDRRWDLHFNTGETLVLPDDEAAAQRAFAEFARLDGVNRLLGRRIKRLDMRDPTRLVLRPSRDGDLGDLGMIVGADRQIERDPPTSASVGNGV